MTVVRIVNISVHIETPISHPMTPLCNSSIKLYLSIFQKAIVSAD